MDWINKLNQIDEKMKSQIHEFGIDSLDKIYAVISKYDTDNKGYVEKPFFEEFLAKIGVFLKTQEISEIHKYLYTYENNDCVYFEAFINLLKSPIPELIINKTSNIFRFLSAGNSTVYIEELKGIMDVKAYHSYKLMLKSEDQVREELNFSLNFVSSSGSYLDENEFLEFHRNIYWVQPKQNLSYFMKMINSLWKYQD